MEEKDKIIVSLREQLRKSWIDDWSFRIKLYNNGNRESVKEQRRGVIICGQ